MRWVLASRKSIVRASTGFTEMTKMRAAIQEFDPYVAKGTLVLMGLMKLVFACDTWGVFTSSWWVREGLEVRCADDFRRRSGAQVGRISPTCFHYEVNLRTSRQMLDMLILSTAIGVDAAWLHAVVHSVCVCVFFSLAAKATDSGSQT